jgi:hypothetical protein
MSTFDDGSTERPSGQSAETTGDIGRGARDSGPGWYHQRLMRAIGALMNRCSDYDKMRSMANLGSIGRLEWKIRR